MVTTASLIHPWHKPGSSFKRLKHCLRGLFFFRATRQWFNLLQRPGLDGLAWRHPHLFQKLQHPYLNRTLSTRQRLQALEQHYLFIANYLPAEVVDEIYDTPGRLLATVPLAGVGTLGLRLSRSQCQKEGDLAISLVNLEAGTRLFSLTFSVTQFAAEPRELFIGGLQGNKAANAKDLVIDITRGLHGVRPKALLLFALQELADAWGVTRIRAVSDANHIYQHWQKRKQLAASYDSWWLEAGGRLAADGMFDVPSHFIPRELSTIRANKRQLYRRRYLQLAEIAGQIKASQEDVIRHHAPAGVVAEIHPAMREATVVLGDHVPMLNFDLTLTRAGDACE
ncbi:MAG: DUF535 family protein [Verrucomicrobiae bacterium]|nr:DUF535 family protein [Verrucomicrobiae bacterium]